MLAAVVEVLVAVVVVLSVVHQRRVICRVVCRRCQYGRSNSRGIERCLPCGYPPSRVSRNPSTAHNLGLSPFPVHSNGLTAHQHGEEGIWLFIHRLDCC